MKVVLFCIALCAFLSFAHMEFTDQYHDFGVNQCTGNCGNFSRDADVLNNLKDQSVYGIREKSSEVFTKILSSLSSLLGHLYRLFLQPWIRAIGYDTSESKDKNFYTVEGRSASDSINTTSTENVDWHELGTTIFTVLKKLL